MDFQSVIGPKPNIAVIHLKMHFMDFLSPSIQFFIAPHHAFAKMQSTRVEFILIMRGIFRFILLFFSPKSYVANIYCYYYFCCWKSEL